MIDLKLWADNPPLYDESMGQEPTELHFLPADIPDGKKAGCVIICAGGSYRIRAWHEAYPYAELFNKAGIHAAVLDYRVAPYHYPAQLYDVQRAVRTVRYHAKEWGVDPDKIAVCGSSAGGHLAVMACEHFDLGREDGDEIDKLSCRPDAGILCYAVATLSKYTDMETRNNITGGNLDLCDRLTGEKNVPDDCPPMFIWHTIGDGAVNVENAIQMASALKAKEIPFEVHLFPQGGHGMGLASDRAPHTAQWGQLCVNWLKYNDFTEA